MKRTIGAAVAALLMTGAAHAGSQPELPAKYHGHWCYDYATDTFNQQADVCTAWINIYPTGFAMSDGRDGPKMYCTLKSTSLKLDVFKCRGNEVGNATEHMRLHIDDTGTLHLGWKTGASK